MPYQFTSYICMLGTIIIDCFKKHKKKNVEMSCHNVFPII